MKVARMAAVVLAALSLSVPAAVPAVTNAVTPAAEVTHTPFFPAGYVSMQTRIFVPNKPPYDRENWAETTMGQIIAPLLAKFPEIKWYWFSRYVQQTEGGDNDDTDISKIAKEYFIEAPNFKSPVHRSLRFRFCLPAAKLADFEAAGNKLIKDQGCAIADWREWGFYATKPGENRSTGEITDVKRLNERSELTIQFYQATCTLTLHHLIGPDPSGYFRFEKNNDPQAMLGSSFATPH
ncbi:MAG: hypothetical protein WCG36_00585, partial [bacterium]